MLHIKEVKPVFTNILTTGDKFEEDVKVNNIIQQDQKKGDLKLYQTVLAVGSAVRDIKVGDKVMINPSAYIRRKYSKNSVQNDLDNNPKISIEIPTVPIYNEDGKVRECLLITDRDIQFVFEGEEVEDNVFRLPERKLVLN